jgi:hypothetical protein
MPLPLSSMQLLPLLFSAPPRLRVKPPSPKNLAMPEAQSRALAGAATVER